MNGLNFIARNGIKALVAFGCYRRGGRACRAVVPTANPKRLTATANRLILARDERSLQVDLVRLDRTVPVAGCIGS